MSWAETKKINSDMREPLNYVHYINDISVFGNKSFVMAKENTNLWNEFCLKSLWLYGHRQIHEYVYKRLDDGNVDDLWNDSGILGQQLNAFYGVADFAYGNGFTVMQNMTTDMFNILETKLQEGYSRFVETFLTGDNVGQWLVDTFKLTSTILPTLKTIDEIIINNEAMTDISKSVQALKALTDCRYSADKISANESASEIIIQNSLSALTINALINNAYFMGAAVQKQNMMHLIANSELAMNAAIKSSIAMDAILNSEIAMDEMAKSETAINTFLVAIDDLSKGTSALQTIQGDINSINSNLPKIIEGNTAEQEVQQAKDTVSGTLTTLNPILSKMVVVKENINKFVHSSTAMNAIANSSTAMKAIANSSTAMNAIANSSTAMNAIANSSTAMNAIANSSTAMNAIANSSTAMNAIASSSTAMNVIASSSTAMKAIANSSTAMNAIANSSTAMKAIANSSTAMNTLYARRSRLSGKNSCRKGKMLILEISSSNIWGSGRNFGTVTFSGNSHASWTNYESKFAYFKKYPKYATYIKNSDASTTWIDYFKIE